MITFWILAIVSVIGAIGVITLKEPVHAALSLVGTLLTVATLYVTLEAHFLAAIQVIVYAGAIMVLFLFVIMLLNVGSDEQANTLPWMKPAAYTVGLVAAAALVMAIVQNPSQLPSKEVIDAALQGGEAEQIGDILFSDFVFAFQLVGVLLLTGIVAAVSLVQRKAETVEAADVAATKEKLAQEEVTRKEMSADMSGQIEAGTS